MKKIVEKKGVRFVVLALAALVVQSIFFLALPLMHALFFEGVDKKQRPAEIVYEVETLVKKKPTEQPKKNIRRVQSPIRMNTPHQSTSRSLKMDLSLALASGGEGVAVGGGGMANAVYEAGEVDQEARLLQEVEARYPRRAQREGIAGFVKVFLVVDERGKPYGVQVLQEEPRGYGFASAALEAVKQYRFKAAEVDNVPVSQKFTKEFRFQVY
jgi:protein TonB